MDKTLIEELLGAAAGSIAAVRPDYVIVNDGESYIAAEEASGVESPEKVLVYFDHDVPTGSPEGARIFGIIRRFAKTNGLRLIQAEGASYQHMLNEIVRPGNVIIGGGSHASIFGAKGALGINVSPTELARVIENGKYNTIVPQTVCIRVTGKLPEGVSVLDAALQFLSDNRDLAGKALEFNGKALGEHEKAILCSMACITGAYTASFTEREKSDLILDLSKAIPMAMLPCSARKEQGKAEIVPLASQKGTELQAGQIGGYTGGTIEELRKAAKLIRGKKLALGFRLSVCPATSRDYIQAMEEGLITEFIDYGAQIAASGDRSVVTQGAGAMGPKEKLATTGLYTFAGCMGCEDAEVYTVSTETVIKASYMKTL